MSQNQKQLYLKCSLSNYLDYPSTINLAVSQMQTGQLNQAQQNLRKAIEIDRFGYLAYYNMFVLNLLKREKGTLLETKDIIENIFKALSCLYVQVSEGNQTLGEKQCIQKALQYCPNNSDAFLRLARFYQKNNDFTNAEKNYQSAIENDLNNQKLYLLRSAFHSKFGKYDQAKEDVKRYWSFPKVESPTIYLKSRQISKQQLTNFQKYLIEKYNQFHLLIKSWNESKKNIEKIQKQLSQSSQQIIIQNQQISKQSQTQQNLDSSQNISQQIKKLETEIQNQRGKVLEVNEQSFSKDKNQQTITAEIDKMAKQIQQIKINQIMQVKSESSVGSKYSQKQIKTEDIKNYKRICLQIVNSQFLDSKNSKQQTRITAKYGKQQQQTPSSKNNYYRNKMTFQIDQSLHQAENDQNGAIKLQLQLKLNSLWGTRNISGKGIIKLQQLGQHKCIISNQKQKFAVLYFKMRLQ